MAIWPEMPPLPDGHYHVEDGMVTRTTSLTESGSITVSRLYVSGVNVSLDDVPTVIAALEFSAKHAIMAGNRDQAERYSSVIDRIKRDEEEERARYDNR